MATKDYWALRCAELEKYAEINRFTANLRKESSLAWYIAKGKKADKLEARRHEVLTDYKGV